LLELGVEPFALVLPLGAGHLLAVADAAFLRNENLDVADHALIATDLARAFGSPRLDARSHSLRPEVSLFAVLGPYRVVLVLVALALLALVWVGYLRRHPARTLPASDAADPSMERFVDALAYLYSRRVTRDAIQVHRAYVQGFRHRLRRAFFGRGQGGDDQLDARLQRELTANPEVRTALAGTADTADVAELTRSVARMESLFEGALCQSSARPTKRRIPFHP
jgi:hypothetical protein